MSFKRWLPLLSALGLMVMVVGVAEATNNKSSKTRTLTRACFWVESKGDRVTYHDVKISRLNRSDVRFCIVGKTGAKGKSVRGIAGTVGPAGAQGLQGERGLMGLQGIQGLTGLTGSMGEIGLQGDDGPIGPSGPQGSQGATGAQGPAGAIGPQGATGAQGTTGAAGAQGATGAPGPAGPTGGTGPPGAPGAPGDPGDPGEPGEPGEPGPPGPPGPAGFSGIVTVAGGEVSGDKQFTVSCPLNATTPDPIDRLTAVSGGFNIQGGVKASFRSAPNGDPLGGTAWTVIQTSGQDLSGVVYVYCLQAAPAP